VRERGVDGVTIPDGGGFGIDRLWGSSRLRECLDAGDDPTDLLPEPSGPAAWAAPGSLLYD